MLIHHLFARVAGEIHENRGDLIADRRRSTRLTDHIVVCDGHQKRMPSVALPAELHLFVIIALDGCASDGAGGA